MFHPQIHCYHFIVYLYFNLQVDADVEDYTTFTASLVAITDQQEVVEMYFDNGKSITATKDMFQNRVGEIDTVDLPATLLVSHSGMSAVNICICDDDF